MRRARPVRPVAGAGVLLALCLGVAGPAAATDDPTDQGLWYYTVTGVADVHATGTTGQGITIAVIDGPINPAVPDLVGTNLVTRPDSFCDADGDGTPDPAIATTENAEHATKMVSLILGTGVGAGGQVGTRGVAPGATVHHYADSTTDNSCDLGSTSGITLAIDQAVADGANIISMSFSGTRLDQDELGALARAEQAGTVLVAASNNRGGTELGWPASANGVISVENADVNLALSDNAVTNPLLTVVAPGIDVNVPTLADGSWERYALATGSSHATAWTSGVLALAWSAHPEATGNQMIQALLRTTGENSGELTRIDDSWGYGTVSVRNLMAIDPTTLPDVNPLLRQDADAQPTYEQIMGTGPDQTTGPTDPAQTTAPTTPKPRPGTDTSGEVGPLLVVGIAIVALLVIAGVVVAVVLARRTNRPRPPGPLGPPGGPYQR